MEADIDLFVVEQHAIDGLDGIISSFSGLVVNEAVALGTTLLVSRDLARQDIAKGSKSIMKSLSHVSYTLYQVILFTYLVVNKLIQVFNEDVALAGFTEGRVTLRPHDPADRS